MKDFYTDYLFSKHYFVVNEDDESQWAKVFVSLAKFFGIYVDGPNMMHLTLEHLKTAERNIGSDVPAPFYRGFPESVKTLSIEEKVLDHALHYLRTYGCNDFSEPGHSLFEQEVLRPVFKENTEPKRFDILTEGDAVEKLKEYAEDLCHGTRQLSGNQYLLVYFMANDYGFKPFHIASRNLAIQLLVDTLDPWYFYFLELSDVPKAASEMHYKYGHVKYDIHRNINYEKHLNLPNKCRKVLTAGLDRIFEKLGEAPSDRIAHEMRICFEKQAEWTGLLHHLHYKGRNNIANLFITNMRGRKNLSYLSEFERYLSKGEVYRAAEFLLESKGQGALLRSLDRILMNCRSDEEVQKVLSLIDTKNIILLLQLKQHYLNPASGPRTFKFIRHGEPLVTHTESEEETKHRKTFLADHLREMLIDFLDRKIRESLFRRISVKTYIDPDMKNIAIPLQEGASNGGFGTLTRGSRIPLPKGKKIRAFTYWEKVHDIDLSVIGIDGQGNQREFSWRSMAYNNNDVIVFSGDETSGYNGGSEYFDVDIEAIRKVYPDMEYIIFCNNVFYGGTFKTCVCRAGYMLRDRIDSGEIFEPKTVQSSFRIDCDSTFAYLFAIDLRTSEFVWLNTNRASSARVAGATALGFLKPYMESLQVMNLYDLVWFSLSNSALLVEDPKEAELVISDKELKTRKDAEIIHSWDTEWMIHLLNNA